MSGNFDGIKRRNFGIEIEMTGLTDVRPQKRRQRRSADRYPITEGFTINIP